MVKMSKRDLQLMALLFFQHLDEGDPQYERACDILLTMMGVSDANGNLTEEYAASEYWMGGSGGEPLRPSAKAEIKAMLPPELWPVLEHGGKGEAEAQAQ